MTYEKWYNTKSNIPSVMHLVVNNTVFIEHYHDRQFQFLEKIKKDTYNFKTEELAIRWLRDRGWIHNQIKYRPKWCILEGDAITGHPMVIGEL